MTTHRKKPVQFTDEKDVSLLRLVLGDNPFNSPKMWQAIATALSTEDFIVDTRRVRERTTLLLSRFRIENADNLKKSGEAEELTEKTVLLQECIDIQREAELSLKNERDTKENQKSKDEEQGKDIRKRALEGLKKDDPSRRSKMSTIDYLKMKTETENSMKEKELELRKRELSLQEQRFQLEREERRAALQIQKQQSETMLKLMEKMTK